MYHLTKECEDKANSERGGPEMEVAFQSSSGENAVPIRPIGCHPSKPLANHSNILSPRTCLSFWLSGSEWLLFNCRSLWLFVWEIDGLLTVAETDKGWPPVQHCGVLLKFSTFRIISLDCLRIFVYIFSKLSNNIFQEE